MPGQHCSPPQALPAYSKNSQPNSEVLLYGLLLGHIWIKSAIPKNGGSPGGTGQDIRPGPVQGKNGEISAFIHPLGTYSLPHSTLGPRDPQMGQTPSLAPNQQRIGRCVTGWAAGQSVRLCQAGACEGDRDAGVHTVEDIANLSGRDGSSLPEMQETREVVSQGHFGQRAGAHGDEDLQMPVR